MDDVNYLRKHAEEESFLFVVDSSRRDTAVYDQPHEYEVAFHAPFRNVVGLDLIDATVPRTEHLVEQGENQLVYTYDGAVYTATVTPGDYNLLQLVEALSAALAPRLTVRPLTTPAELSNKVEFLGDAPFTLHASSSLGKALGLGVRDLSVVESTAGAKGTQTVLQGPLPAAEVVTLQLNQATGQQFVAPARGTLTTLNVYVRSTAPVQLRATVVRAAGNENVAWGEASTGGADFEQLTIPLQDSQTLLAGQAYKVFVAVQSTPGSVDVFCSGPALLTPSTEWAPGMDTLCLDLQMQADAYVARPSGVVDLTGEAYVLVRCPEIEQQLYRDRAFESVHAGLGLVKLANYGFREQRYDFVSFPPRRLPTPIGKLSKLTIRLEKGDGTLYDTKGVNHHLVLVVRYLELAKGPDPTRSTLNPGYLPNPLHYLQQSYSPLPRPTRQ